MAAKRRRSSTKKVAKRATRRRPRSNPAREANPPVVEDLVHYVAPAAGGYAAGRIGSHLAVSFVPQHGRAMQGAASVSAPAAIAALAWYLAHRRSTSSPDRTWHGVMVGATIAALQSLLQSLTPALGVMLDCPVRNSAMAAAQLPAPDQSAHRRAGRMRGRRAASPPPQGAAPAPAPRARDPIDELLDEIEDNDDVTGANDDIELSAEDEASLRSGIFQ